jgi:hypothetical protein
MTAVQKQPAPAQTGMAFYTNRCDGRDWQIGHSRSPIHILEQQENRKGDEDFHNSQCNRAQEPHCR